MTTTAATGTPPAVIAAPATAEIPAHQIAAFVVMLGLLIVAPFFVYPVFLMKALCFALFACAFDLLIGYVGLLSFGHAVFLGSAGYVSAHAAKVWGLPPELAILAGTAAGAVLGLAIGALAIRSRGIYFANITLALAQMIYFFCAAGEVHRGRGRHPVGAAGPAAGRAGPAPALTRSTSSSWRSSCSAS